MIQDKAALRSFLRQGFESYPAALEAVETFESEMWRAIRRAFDEAKWTNIGRTSGPAQTPKEGRTGGAARWLWSYVEGATRGDDKTWITLGVCWNPPKQPNLRVVAYATVTAGSRMISIDDKPGRNPRVHVGSLDRNERRPFVVVDDEFDPETDFALLLEALDAGVPPLGANPAAGAAP